MLNVVLLTSLGVHLVRLTRRSFTVVTVDSIVGEKPTVDMDVDLIM